jgi:acyl-homoserine lactone acylase PvdQ
VAIGLRGAAALSVAAIAAFAPAAGAQAPRHLDPAFLTSIEDAQLHGTVTPPGSDSRHATTEIAAYDDLVQGFPKLTDEELRTRYFKTLLFGKPIAAGRTYSPRGDVTVVRDAKWGEPIISGLTDGGMAFGAGYVAAEDRLAIMELLRAIGRSETFELAGTAAAWLADAEAARLYGYTEAEWQEQIDRLPREYGKPGADIVAMLEEYVKGINAYIAEAERGEVPLPLGLSDLGIGAPAPWRPTDVVAAVSTVRSLFGAGGGSELNNAAVLAGLVEDFGAKGGRAIYDDFRNRDNADGPVHTTKSFPYALRDESKLDPKATAVEPGAPGGTSAKSSELAALAERARLKTERLKVSILGAAVDLSRPNSMSNHLVIGSSRSATGHPQLIGGPQAGYFSPQILMDYTLHSPTIHARGAGFPGLSVIVVMGRTQSYAWTPTAGGSDMIDTYVDKLCDPGGGTVTEDSRFYEFKGKCVSMERRTLRESESAPPAIANQVPDIVVERTVHGPVMARGTLGGKPIAITRKRSTYMKELDAAVSILKMNRNEARTGDKFVDIFRESHNLSTNWSYANDREIAYVHGGLYPKRPVEADPDLPVWGTGEWEWEQDSRGRDAYVGREGVPHEVAPSRDFFVSWNNRPAPQWSSADAQWGHTSVYRADLLEHAILTQQDPITPVRLVQMMERAGLTDLRGAYVLPLALRVLEKAGGIGPRERRMIDLLIKWAADGALRRDGDRDGDYDHSAAVAIMDAWWEKLIRAVYDPVIENASRIPLPFDNAPGPTGSAYQDGWYGYLWTDLAMALGYQVRSKTSRIYCGGSKDASGSLGECAKRVLASLMAAGDELGGSDPGAWSSNAEAERIRFLPGAALSMHWVNRPTTQQIAMFGALTPACARGNAFLAAGARPSGRGLDFSLRPRGGPVSVEVFHQASGRRILGGKSVARFAGQRGDFRWNASKRLASGYYVIRFVGRAPGGGTDVRRIAVRRSGGRFGRAYTVDRRRSCAPVDALRLGRGVFGGLGTRALGVTLRMAETKSATIEVSRGGRLVKSFAAATYAANRTYRLRLPAKGLRRGRYRVVVKVAGKVVASAAAQRL